MKNQRIIKRKFVNLGAGNPAQDWLNLDSSPHFLMPKFLHFILYRLHLSQRSRYFLSTNYQYFKYTKSGRLPFKTNSISAVYSSHFLEHITAEEIRTLIDELYRVINKKGVIRIIIPDLEQIYENRNKNSNDCWFSLSEHLSTLPKELVKNKMRLFLEAMYGFPSLHKTLILKKKIVRTLEKQWKVEQNYKYLESKIDKKILKQVESVDRIKNSIVLELYPRK